MVNQSGWHEGNLPPQNGVYLVRITPMEGWDTVLNIIAWHELPPE